MNRPAKFMFDTDFNGPAAPPPVAFDEVEAMRASHAAELAEARREATEAGREEGRREALATIENQLLETIEKLAAGKAEIEHQIAERLAAVEAGSLRLATVAADKLAAGLIARQPTEHIEQFFANCLALLPVDTSLQLFVAPAFAPLLQERLELLLARGGRHNPLQIFADETVDGADCRLTWAEGGIEQSQDRLHQQIEQIVAAFLAAGDETL